MVSRLTSNSSGRGWAQCLVWLGLLPWFGGTALADAFETRIRPLLDTYCFRCHGDKKAKAGINLMPFKDATSVFRDPKLWEKVLSQVRDRQMPPDDEATPTAEEYHRMIDWLTSSLENPSPEVIPRDPGVKPVHRLSRTEYNNTIRDLLGVNTRPADKFPGDGGGGGGFDNNADTLFVPPILMERYLVAAEDVLAAAAPERLYATRPVWYSSARVTARDNIRWFTRRAFRRPVNEEEVTRFLGLYDKTRAAGGDHETALKTVYKAVLVSPHFLFRVEVDPAGREPGPITDHELAVRLSYFIWSSMPDEELFRLADRRELSAPGVLEGQVRRMLKDPKARALAENFAGQWFSVRNLFTGPQPDQKRFPGYTETVREAVAAEPVEVFHHMVQADRPLTDLLDADYTFANKDLAAHYGLAGAGEVGASLQRVALTDADRAQGRGGLVGMGALLVQTSYPLRSSPVLRGKWILEEILGTPPPPPPPIVKTLPADDRPQKGLTFRQQLEEHRKNPSCAACHQRLDPLGFALENFDPTGRWRTQIGGEKVDARGTLGAHEEVDGPIGLKRALVARKGLFLRHATEKMLAYALGRGLEYYDMPVAKRIAAGLESGDARTTALILEVVKSFPFQNRRGAEATLAGVSDHGAP